jgi:predicted Ser/Thr protein kinase
MPDGAAAKKAAFCHGKPRRDSPEAQDFVANSEQECGGDPAYAMIAAVDARLLLAPTVGLSQTAHMSDLIAGLEDAPTRLCPKCGSKATAAVCAADSTATIDLDAFQTADWQLTPGQIVAGKYRIVAEIARGGHGTVYRAEHLLGWGTVALKLPGRESTDIVDLRRFFREAQVSARLTGAHTARVFDVGQTEQGALYLAMEYVDGPTLETVLRHLRDDGAVMTEAEATRIALDVLDGLTEAHAAGLVHRDLKPANIAIRRSDGAVKILDFGLALVHDSSLTPHERAMGTPHYMSPEQCHGGEVDGRADLYALGVVLYRMVCGKLPFLGEGTMAVLWGHVHRPVPDVASHAQTQVSPAFAQVVMRALAKRPNRRFASAAAMREALATGDAQMLDLTEWPAGKDGDVANEEDRTASASGIAVAAAPVRRRLSRLLAWPLAGACVALLLLAWRMTTPAPALLGPPKPRLPSLPAVAVETPPVTQATSEQAPLAALPAAQTTLTMDREPLPLPRAKRPHPVRAIARETQPDWKKPLLPQ